jgi:hypothetical protein
MDTPMTLEPTNLAGSLPGMLRSGNNDLKLFAQINKVGLHQR